MGSTETPRCIQLCVFISYFLCIVVPNRRYWGCLALDHAHTRCFLLASAWSDRWCKQLRTKKWLVTCEVKPIFLQIAVKLQNHKTPFSPKKSCQSTHFLGYIFFRRKPKIHTSNGRTIGPTYQWFIYQWMLSNGTMSFLPSPLILDRITNFDDKSSGDLTPRSLKIHSQTANPNSEPERCVLHQICEVIL